MPFLVNKRFKLVLTNSLHHSILSFIADYIIHNFIYV